MCFDFSYHFSSQLKFSVQQLHASLLIGTLNELPLPGLSPWVYFLFSLLKPLVTINRAQRVLKDMRWFLFSALDVLQQSYLTKMHSKHFCLLPLFPSRELILCYSTLTFSILKIVGSLNAEYLSSPLSSCLKMKTHSP